MRQKINELHYILFRKKIKKKLNLKPINKGKAFLSNGNFNSIVYLNT